MEDNNIENNELDTAVETEDSSVSPWATVAALGIGVGTAFLAGAATMLGQRVAVKLMDRAEARQARKNAALKDADIIVDASSTED